MNELNWLSELNWNNLWLIFAFSPSLEIEKPRKLLINVFLKPIEQFFMEFFSNPFKCLFYCTSKLVFVELKVLKLAISILTIYNSWFMFWNISQNMKIFFIMKILSKSNLFLYFISFLLSMTFYMIYIRNCKFNDYYVEFCITVRLWLTGSQLFRISIMWMISS